MTDSTFSIPFASIDTSDRGRSKENYGDLSGLAASIASVGSIHPIILSRETDGSYRLVAGGRRCAAMATLGVTEVFHGSVLTPGKPGFLFRDEVPEDVLREAELDENLHRLDMEWVDTCVQILRIYELKRKIDPTWDQKKTAQLIRRSRGAVSNFIAIAKLCVAGDEEILKCKTFDDAMNVRMKRAEDKALAELQQRNAARLRLKGPAATASFLDTFSVNTNGETSSPVQVQNPEPSKATPSPVHSAVEINLSGPFRCCDNRSVPWPSVDHIITDIPYGIDMDNLEAENLESVREAHDVEENVSLMEGFMERAFGALRPGGFCVFFYDLEHHKFLSDLADAVGFRRQRWPLIWHKIQNCRNGAAQFNFTKNYEVAMVLRKDGTAILRKPQSSSIFQHSSVPERSRYNHPFYKPFGIVKDIIDAICLPGATVLDPYAGEMSIPRALVMCGMQPFAMEKEETHFNRGLEHVKEAYRQVCGKDTTFV